MLEFLAAVLEYYLLFDLLGSCGAETVGQDKLWSFKLCGAWERADEVILLHLKALMINFSWKSVFKYKLYPF